MALLPPEVKCPVCGKIFMRWDGWVFTRNNRDYCSWFCYRKCERRPKKFVESNRISPEAKLEIAELLKDGMKPKEIAERIGVTYQAILYYKRKAEA
jgi:hypothetical protein